MGAVVLPIKHDDRLHEFFSFMFEEVHGYVYAPTLHPTTKAFEQYFFEWPAQKEELVNHVRRFSATHEIYYGPALYRDRKATKDAFLGTFFVWAEFDGRLPDSISGIPEPSIKIQSSDTSHQHWYWKLDSFISDSKIAEQISRRVTYFLQADLSVWNANRVLRPPNTVHHESSLRTSIIRWDETRHGIQEFAGLPDVGFELLGADDNVGPIPDPIEVIFKYPFNPDDADFFRLQTIKPGHETGSGKGRSAALARIGHICAEMGMSSAETLSLLYHADDRWGKYKHRSASARRNVLLGIVNYARAKHPINPVTTALESPLKVYTYADFMAQERTIEWVIKDFVHKKGLLVTFGPAGTGKSQLLLRACQSISTGKNFLKWQVEKPLRMLYISLEMFDEELYEFLRVMKFPNDPLLNTNFMVMPLGRSIKMNSSIAKKHLSAVVNEFQPDGIVIDSFGKAVGENLSESKVIFEVLEYIDDELRDRAGCFVWMIHHPRKGQVGNKKPKTLDDMFGSGYLGNGATNVFTLWKTATQGLLDIECLKLRMATEFEPFKIKRTPNLDFEVIHGAQAKENLISPSKLYGSLVGGL